MKIFSAAQIKACDAYTIQSEGIASHSLMERAATACVQWIMHTYPIDVPFIVLCGMGNNGGDGFAITRLLHMSGYSVKAFLLTTGDHFSPDCHLNFTRLLNIDSSLVAKIEAYSYLEDIPEDVVIVDAIFGTGLNRPISGWVGNFIQHINSLPNTKIAIDIPSGLPADTVPESQATVFQANHTLSFQFYKRSFLHPEGGQYTGKISVLDIQLSTQFIQHTPANYHIVSLAEILRIYQPRSPFSHKGTYGHAWLIGGKYGMAGAISLASKAALRIGAGKLTAIIPEALFPIIQTSVPEAMCMSGGEKCVDHIPDLSKHQISAIGIGPGMGTDRKTLRTIESLLDHQTQPMVIDADALNLIADRKDLLHKIPPESILTPHPKEFDRIFGTSTHSMMRLESARNHAMQYNICIILKDHYAATILPDGSCYYNPTGTPALATAGSGDVLTGMLTGLLAQGYKPFQAAMLGVYIHGIAGQLAESRHSEEAVLASDVIDHIGLAFQIIRGNDVNHLVGKPYSIRF